MKENPRLREAAQRAYVILEGLRLAVEWELAPAIKREIAEVAPLLAAALADGGEAPMRGDALAEAQGRKAE